MPHHSSDKVCLLCEYKLAEASPPLGVWFRTTVKTVFPDCHISWSFRDQAEQDQCVADGKSQLKWPDSPHNNMISTQGGPVPQSLALDLFQIDDAGKAQFHKDYYQRIADLRGPVPITWGGSWASLHDYDHFELSEYGHASIMLTI